MSVGAASPLSQLIRPTPPGVPLAASPDPLTRLEAMKQTETQTAAVPKGGLDMYA